MRRIALVLGLAAVPAVAGAACVTPDTLDKGVVFKRADGRTGSVTRKDGGIFIDYASGPGYWTDERQTRLGIYEDVTTQFFSDEETVGGGDTVLTWKFRGKPVVPEEFGSWKTRISAYGISYNSSEIGYQDWKDKLDVVFDFKAAKTVTLSNCDYRVVPVEATFVGEENGFTRRWLYFSDLGFGLETRRGSDEIGLAALKPAGSGLRRSA